MVSLRRPRVEVSEMLATALGAPAERLTQLQRQLRCGTECGSCLPTLKRLVAEQAPSMAT